MSQTKTYNNKLSKSKNKQQITFIASPEQGINVDTVPTYCPETSEKLDRAWCPSRPLFPSILQKVLRYP